MEFVYILIYLISIKCINKFELDMVRNRYHCIFKCGSQSNRESKCLIIPQSQFAYSNNKQNYDASKTNIDDNG